MSEEGFLPDIEDYLALVDDNLPVSIENLEELVYKVRAYTGFPKETCEILVREFFQQIRNEVLKGKEISIGGLGKFYISSPKNYNKRKTFFKFKPFKELLKKLRNE